MGWGIYVHIPFCQRKCFYCDFPSYAGQRAVMPDYTAALCREAARQGAAVRQSLGPVRTIYIGGGTPTVLLPGELARIGEALQQAFVWPPEVEYTVEANPGTIDAEKLQVLAAMGVNRLSLGVQSFDDVLLQRIGRIHTGEAACQAVEAAQQAGFRNISLDLMYGLPGQSLQQLQDSVAQALALAVQHISIYGLQVEPGTVFARWQEQGRLVLPSDEETEAMYDFMTEELPRQGYQRYEISNFARPGFESRHNLGYWQDVPYLGLGAAAHSYLQGHRMANTADPGEYIRLVSADQSPAHEEEPQSRDIAMEEFAFLALRTAQGIDRAAFAARFGCSLDSVYREVVDRMLARGLLAEDAAGVRLTALGMKYGNLVFEAFLL